MTRFCCESVQVVPMISIHHPTDALATIIEFHWEYYFHKMSGDIKLQLSVLVSAVFIYYCVFYIICILHYLFIYLLFIYLLFIYYCLTSDNH